MRFTSAVDQYIADMRAEDRIRSPHTELAYRTKLVWLAEAAGNRPPRMIGYEDVKRALGRWQGNSRVQAHAIYRSFFDWAMSERIADTNPARMVRPGRRREPRVAKLTRDEVVVLLQSTADRRRDRWVAYLGVCAGLRSQELRSIQGRDFARPGWIHVIGKGDKERWIPVIADLELVVGEIVSLIGMNEYVLPGRRPINPPYNTILREDPATMLSPSALYKQVVAMGEAAGLAHRIHPHTLRHAFAEMVAKAAGVRVAQELLGHANMETTAGYTERPTLDELAVSVQGFSFFPTHQVQKGRNPR